MRPPLGAWRFIAAFGVISLCADIVYEGARSVSGPLLAGLGASAALVGVITGLGEAAALGLRLVSGPLTDRTRAFWRWTIAGYALSVLSVPLLGFTGLLWVACALVLAERVGKAVRSPAKDTLLSFAAASAGRGRGFAVHESLDQIGALLGPLTVAAALALSGGDFRLALGVLAAPAAAVLALLLWLRLREPHPERYETHSTTTDPTDSGNPEPFPPAFRQYAVFTAVTLAGFATFGVVSFHLVTRGGYSTSAVAVLYAAAMAVDAVAALISGWVYDRSGARVLAALPLLSALAAVFVFVAGDGWMIAGVLLWGAAVGVQESTMRAVVADLVGPQRRATAYGVYAAAGGVALAAGGALTGLLYDVSIPVLVLTLLAMQAAALGLFAWFYPQLPRTRTGPPAATPAPAGPESPD
ncbi:MFS transporter [Nocardia huaxiensis]|uniref:MFS transporter n=1 Tax=Nocardia huaxiensis TaxID=2755382 RepID=A0A7D6V6B3_9NOCA|nr:MFS transporter [Nocardia huaxiensis]QLY28592.1 MFS transporter [Nocardia huaxiensis]UFS97937.1 MFS transporter [Nocardia huaxiensis]